MPYQCGLALDADRQLRPSCTLMSDEEITSVAAILCDWWDPIGVRDLDESPEREYLYEAAVIVRLLADGAGVNELAAYLTEAATELGTPDARRDTAAAEAIVRALGGAA